MRSEPAAPPPIPVVRTQTSGYTPAERIRREPGLRKSGPSRLRDRDRLGTRATVARRCVVVAAVPAPITPTVPVAATVRDGSGSVAAAVAAPVARSRLRDVNRLPLVHVVRLVVGVEMMPPSITAAAPTMAAVEASSAEAGLGAATSAPRARTAAPATAPNRAMCVFMPSCYARGHGLLSGGARVTPCCRWGDARAGERQRKKPGMFQSGFFADGGSGGQRLVSAGSSAGPRAGAAAPSACSATYAEIASSAQRRSVSPDAVARALALRMSRLRRRPSTRTPSASTRRPCDGDSDARRPKTTHWPGYLGHRVHAHERTPSRRELPSGLQGQDVDERVVLAGFHFRPRKRAVVPDDARPCAQPRPLVEDAALSIHDDRPFDASDGLNLRFEQVDLPLLACGSISTSSGRITKSRSAPRPAAPQPAPPVASFVVRSSPIMTKGLAARGAALPLAVHRRCGCRNDRTIERIGRATEWRNRHLSVGQDDFVFQTTTGSSLHPSNVISRVFLSLIEKGEGPDHHLPRTCGTLDATRLRLENINVKVVSERLGHKNILITLTTYAHSAADDAGGRRPQLSRGSSRAPQGTRRTERSR